MPYISVITVSPFTKAEAVEAKGATAGPSPGSLAGVQIVDPVTLLRSVRPMTKNVFTATRKDILASFVLQNNVASLLDQMLEAHLKTTVFMQRCI